MQNIKQQFQTQTGPLFLTIVIAGPLLLCSFMLLCFLRKTKSVRKRFVSLRVSSYHDNGDTSWKGNRINSTVQLPSTPLASPMFEGSRDPSRVTISLSELLTPSGKKKKKKRKKKKKAELRSTTPEKWKKKKSERLI
eukprot:snap_masked-scaffold_18-processed-gene-4.12-mRNA-1 protein AED:1.00 eAED:1.00 QI:0/-1/0/0/-1/1/1/0/136